MKLTQNYIKDLIKEEINLLLGDRVNEASVLIRDPAFDAVKDIEIPDQDNPFQPYTPSLSQKIGSVAAREVKKIRKKLKNIFGQMKKFFRGKKEDVKLEDVFTMEGKPEEVWPETDEEFRKVFGMEPWHNEFAFFYWQALNEKKRLEKLAQQNPEGQGEILAAIPIEDEEVSILPAIAIDDDGNTILPAIAIDDDATKPYNRRDSVEEASSEKQRKWACAQSGSARKSFKGKPSLTKKQAAEFCADTKLSGKKKKKK